MRPFIYIGSLRRTGSTLLSEMLTHPPRSFILVEPRLAENIFGLADADSGTLAEHGIDLKRPLARWNALARLRRGLGVDGEYMLRVFRRRVEPRLLACFEQIGVKEIRHRNWRSYVRHFPDMRAVLTSRDPRDIYISLHHRVRKGRGSWQGPLTPERLAADLQYEFRFQQQMADELDCALVRYEDLCTDPAAFARVKDHVRSGIPAIGDVGGFLGRNPSRKGEHELHEGRITDRRIHRWLREEDAELRRAAEKMFDLMPEYCDFWGYVRRP